MYIDCSMFPTVVTDRAFDKIREDVDCLADDDYILTENDQTITVDATDGTAYYLKTTVQENIRKEVYSLSNRFSEGEPIPLNHDELEDAIRKCKRDCVEIVQ